MESPATHQESRDLIEDLQLRDDDHTDCATLMQRRLDAVATRAWERMEDTPRDHPMRETYRDLAFAAKDRADAYAREMTVPSTTDSAKNQVTEGESTTLKEK